MAWGFCDNCEKVINCGFLGTDKPIDTIHGEIYLERKNKYGIYHRIGGCSFLFCSKKCAIEFLKREIEKL